MVNPFSPTLPSPIMSSTSTQPPSSAPPTLLTLPLEIRQLIYSHLLQPVLIFPDAPLARRDPSIRYQFPQPARSSSYLHPSPPQPLVYNLKHAPGSRNTSSRLHIPIRSHPGSARRLVYSVPARTSPLPIPAQLVCRRLHDELTDFALKSGAWTFCFHDFEALIRFLKGRGAAWATRTPEQRASFLAQITSVIIELRLNLTATGQESQPQTAAMQLAERVARHETNTRRDLANVHQNGQTVLSQRAAEERDAQARTAWMAELELEVGEEDMPWLDALRMLGRACPRLHTLGLYAELTGPEIQVLGFGDAGGGLQTQPRDWPPGAMQKRADFGPVVSRLCEFVEGFKGLRRCAVTVWAGHQLKNLAADPGDGSLAARFWEEAELADEVEERMRRCERGLGDGEEERLGLGFDKAVVIDMAERRRKQLAVRGRDMNWY